MTYEEDLANAPRLPPNKADFVVKGQGVIVTLLLLNHYLEGIG